MLMMADARSQSADLPSLTDHFHGYVPIMTQKVQESSSSREPAETKAFRDIVRIFARSSYLSAKGFASFLRCRGLALAIVLQSLSHEQPCGERGGHAREDDFFRRGAHVVRNA